MADYATLINVKTRLQIKSIDVADDNFLSLLITRASAIIDSFTDNHFVKVSGTRKFDLPYKNPRRILLDDWLLVCTSVTNGNGVVIPATEYITEDYNNPPYYSIELKNVSSYFFQPESANMNDRKCISVVGDWGWSATCPVDIAEACERLVVASYKSRDGVNMTGSTVITPAGVLQTPLTLTRDVIELIQPYQRTMLSVSYQ